MKKILVLSGKGGTGKTTVASSLIYLLKSKSFADCDVDAPNLHLTVKHGDKTNKKDFFGLPKAKIDKSKCIHCCKCIKNCKFGAISLDDNHSVIINQFECEGCKVCEYVCPSGAITMEQTLSGETFVYEGDNYFSTAKLKMGSGASGKLVTQVKKNMRNISDNNEIAVIDGSPGVGCPVMASITGVNVVLIVTEPTVSGISDLKRILKTVNFFKTKCAVCINKYDINNENTELIKKFCVDNEVEVIGMLPYYKEANETINQGKSIVEVSNKAKDDLQNILNNLLKVGGIRYENSSCK